jgi:hypothetical protein
MWHVTCTRETRNACKNLAEKPEGSRTLGRLRHRWENIKINFKEMGWKGVVWICLTKDMIQWWVVVNTLMYFQFP